MKWAGHRTFMGAMKISYKIVVGKPEGDVRRRSRSKDITKTDLTETGYVVANCLQLLPVMNKVLHLWGFLEQLSHSDHPKKDPTPCSLLLNTRLAITV
jgi:hypothetical protein